MKVIIIGAGISGLYAARELSSKGIHVTILEAANKAGGRITSIQPPGFSVPIETGAEFIHGDLPLTQKLLKNAGIPYSEMEGRLYHYSNGSLSKDENFLDNEDDIESKIKKLKYDITLAEFLKQNVKENNPDAKSSVKRFIEGFDAADIDEVSTLSVKDDLSGQGLDKTYVIEGGYITLIQSLGNECEKNGCEMIFDEIVEEVSWKKNNITVKCKSGKEYTAEKILLTLPVGYYKANSIRFVPGIPDKIEAISQMGFGNVIKIFYEFTEPVWENSAPGLSFLIPHDSPFTAFWTYYPMNNIPLLTAWSAGPFAKEFRHKDPDEIRDECLHFISKIFREEMSHTKKKLKAWHVVNWENETLFNGAYGYHTVESFSKVEELSKDIEDTIFFAGEAFNKGKSIGTVEAALESAKSVLDKIKQIKF